MQWQKRSPTSLSACMFSRVRLLFCSTRWVTRWSSTRSRFFFFYEAAPTEIYTLSLHDALPISGSADNVLLPLALSMRAHHHGGSLLVVPHGSDAWRKSIVSVPYQVAPPFSKLGDLVRTGTRDGAFKEATDAIGGLTAVDGAVVLSDRWDVLAFGAKIGRTESGPFVEEVLVREPILGHTPIKVPASEVGGTRHLSAAQFVHEQRDSLALVASQDGRFTVFGWSPRAHMVHAYRVEALLL